MIHQLADISKLFRLLSNNFYRK